MIRLNGMNYGGYFGYGSSSGINSIFGGSSGYNSIYSNLSQLSSVRSGAYAKALKTYYSTDSKSPIKTAYKNYNLDTNLYTDKALTNVKNQSSELISSAEKLASTGKDNLFANKDSYNPDNAYKAVSDFVNEYNDTVSALGKTTNTSVVNVGYSMTRMTNIMKTSLGKAGIKVGTDGKLTINEEDFKKADMNTVKNLFGSNSSYAKIISSTASRLQSTALKQSLNGNSYYNTGSVYGSNGSYYNNYYSGFNFNSFF